MSVVNPLLAEAARIRLGQDLAKAETEPALLREFVAATWPDGMAPSLQTTFKTATGDPAAAILETATSEAADLIVMGTQGLGGLRKWLLGIHHGAPSASDACPSAGGAVKRRIRSPTRECRARNTADSGGD